MVKINIIIFIFLFQIKVYASNNYFINFPLESDTVFSAWVIKTYVNKNAKFYSAKKTSKIIVNNKYYINTSKSIIRRTSRFTAFEMALNYHNIKTTKCIKNLINIIRVVEMTPWKKYEHSNIVEFEYGLVNIFTKNIANNLNNSFDYINKYCKNI